MPLEKSTPQEIQIGNHIVPLAVRRLRNAKRISLRMSPAKNSLLMTLPRRTSLASGIRFLHSQSGWILENLTEENSIVLYEGAVIPILGRDYTIRRQEGRGTTQLDHDRLCLTVHCQSDFVARRVRDFLRKYMQQACAAQLEPMTAMLEKALRKVLISKAGSRWGSCTSEGIITINWLLVFAPPDILRYVIAHEPAHLVEMNHSPRFWRLVERLHPGAQDARKWLHREGHRLHRYE